MSIQFLVEDGTGLLLANSYLSERGFTDYWDITNPDWDYSGFTDDEILGALIRATRYIDGRYRGRWPGAALKGRGQALAWPRTGLFNPALAPFGSPVNTPAPFAFITSVYAQDADGNDIDNASVPREVQSACAELAMREVVQPYVLTPDKVSQRTLSVAVPGAVSITYERMGDQRPVVVIADEMLSGLIVAPANANILMRA